MGGPFEELGKYSKQMITCNLADNLDNGDDCVTAFPRQACGDQTNKTLIDKINCLQSFTCVNTNKPAYEQPCSLYRRVCGGGDPVASAPAGTN